MKTTLLSQNTLHLLKAYIASHAVFNALTYVQNQIAADEKRAALKALSTFANFIRKTADDIELTNRSIEKEWEMLKVYCTLEQWRFGDRLSIQVDDQAPENVQTASFLFVPYIEQIILKGLSSNVEQLEIRIEQNKAMGLKVTCNYPLDTLPTHELNAEQNNRKLLLENRYELLNELYDISTYSEDNIANLTIHLK